ncbi:hypothetical protein LINPERHAP1_LOCUS16305 [Linum perenne]
MILDDGLGILNHSVSDCSAFAGVRSSEKWGSDEADFYPRLSRRKSFSRAIKSIASDLFQSSRSKDRKLRIRSSDSTTRVPSLTQEFDASSSSMSSVSGSESETPSTAGETRKPDPVPERKKYGILVMFLLLLASVAVTVLGGKLLGVALTLICVFLVPRRWGIVGGSSETECRKQRMLVGGLTKMMSHRRLNLESLIRFRELQVED